MGVTRAPISGKNPFFLWAETAEEAMVKSCEFGKKTQTYQPQAQNDKEQSPFFHPFCCDKAPMKKSDGCASSFGSFSAEDQSDYLVLRLHQNSAHERAICCTAERRKKR